MPSAPSPTNSISCVQSSPRRNASPVTNGTNSFHCSTADATKLASSTSERDSLTGVTLEKKQPTLISNHLSLLRPLMSTPPIALTPGGSSSGSGGKPSCLIRSSPVTNSTVLAATSTPSKKSKKAEATAYDQLAPQSAITKARRGVIFGPTRPG